MKNNIPREDLDAVCTICCSRTTRPDAVRPTCAASRRNGRHWLGVRHSVFVNSGSSANLVTLAALRELHGPAAR